MWNTWSDFDRTFAALDELRRRMDYVFGDLDRATGRDWSRAGFTGLAAGQWPRTHLQDAGDELVLYALVPGVADRDLNMTATQDTLTISGKRTAEIPKGYSVHRQERGSYDFSRSFSLPTRIDPEKVAAELHSGVLTVRMAKAADVKPRQISVKASA